MRKLTTKLLFAIISAAFALVALGTTTFAWFTLTNEATISPFNAEITAGEGIEISLDGTNFYTTIPATVIQAKINSMNIELKDVTSSDGIVMTKIDGTTPGTTTVPFLSTLGANDKNAFIQFDLWVRSPKAGTKVQLKSVTFDSKIKNPDNTLVDPTPWNTDVIFANAKGQLVVPYEDDAALIAAIESDLHPNLELNSDKTQVTYKSKTYTLQTDEEPKDVLYKNDATYYAENALRLSISEVTILDDETETESESLVVFEKPASVTIGGVIDDTNTVLGSAKKPDGMVDYYDNKNGTNLLDTYSGFIPVSTVDLSTPKDLVTLENANDATQLRIRIWVEGWDPDTFNAILKQVILAQIVFGSPNA